MQVTVLILLIFNSCMYSFNPYAVSQSVNKEKAMAPHSSTLPWKIPWTEESGRQQFMGPRRVGQE